LRHPETITEQEMINAIRSAVCDMKFVPMMCGSAFKNKGVQAVLRCSVCISCQARLDVDAVKGTPPKK
jgi:elongation factor G